MKGETILVVDDNVQLARFLAERSLPELGYQSLAVYSGKKALEALNKTQFSLMLLDLELPDTTGLELLRKLDQEGISIPTILCTAHGSESIAADAFRLGVEDYLIKPVDIDDLERSITRALSKSRLHREAANLTAQLREQINGMQILFKIGQSLTSTLELNEVLCRIVEAGVRLSHSEEGYIALLDISSGKLFLRAAKNIEETRIKTMHIAIDDTLIGNVLRSGKPIRTSMPDEGNPIKVCTGFLVQSLLHVPIISKGRPLGVLSVDNRMSKNSFSNQDEMLLASLADYAAVALENASLFQKARQELTDRKKAEQALQVSEERYALAVQGANDGIWDWNLKTNQVYYSSRWKAMLGYDDFEIGNALEEWFNRIHPQDVEQVKLTLSSHLKGLTPHFKTEYRMAHKDGSYHWIVCRGLAIREEGEYPHRMAGSQTDITEQKEAEEKFKLDALHDRLTGLPNRNLFMDRLQVAVERAKRKPDFVFAVLFLDLDRFKDVNDSLGHQVGDQLLNTVAQMLKSNLRSTDTVARFGGDEFVILLEDIKNLSNVVPFAEWILKRLLTPVQLVDHEVFTSTSIGIVASTIGYQQPEDMLRDADIAMYAAKANGRARYEIFNPEMREQTLQRLELEVDLRRAIEQGDFFLCYQPIISLKSNCWIGLEALVRWRHPRRGVIYPNDFIPIAEDTGLIIPLGRWIMREACNQLKQWQTRFPSNPPLSVSVNLSSRQFAQPSLCEEIKKNLQDTGLDGKYLKLEITETTAMVNSPKTVQTFNELKELDIQVQIDDFGTGYSSLSYLHEFPLKTIKIDRSFVRQMNHETNNPEIVEAVVKLAHDLGMETVAEGVETETQLAYLTRMGCEYGQGFLLATPLEKQEIEKLLTEAGQKDRKNLSSHLFNPHQVTIKS